MTNLDRFILFVESFTVKGKKVFDLYQSKKKDILNKFENNFDFNMNIASFIFALALAVWGATAFVFTDFTSVGEDVALALGVIAVALGLFLFVVDLVVSFVLHTVTVLLIAMLALLVVNELLFMYSFSIPALTIRENREKKAIK